MNRTKAILEDILNSAQSVIDFKRDINQTNFSADVKTQSAILHKLLIMGEAVKRLPVDFRLKYSEIPWKKLTGMRDKIIHEYDAVDLDIIWITITRDIPTLIELLKPILKQDEDKE